MEGPQRVTERASDAGDRRRTAKAPRCTRRGFVAGVGAAGTVGGVSGLPRAATAATASPSTADITQPSQLSERWAAALSGTVQDYLVESDRLYVVTADGTVRALDVVTGQERTRTELGESIKPYGLAKAGQYLAVGLASSRLTLIDAATLSAAVTIPLDGEFRGLAAKDGAVFLATTSAVRRISIPDGTTQWRFDRRDISPIWATSAGIGVNARPQRPGAGSNFYLISESDGAVVWQQGVSAGGLRDRAGNWLQATEFWALTELESHLIAGVVGGTNYSCFDKFTGEKLWTTNGGDHVNRAVAGSHGVVHQDGSTLVSRALTTGESQWETAVVAPHPKGLSLYDGSLVVFGTRTRDGADVMMALDPTSRAITVEQEVDGPIGLVSTVGNVAFGVNLVRDELRAYLPENAQVDIPDSTTPPAGTNQRPSADGTTPSAGPSSTTSQPSAPPDEISPAVDTPESTGTAIFGIKRRRIAFWGALASLASLAAYVASVFSKRLRKNN